MGGAGLGDVAVDGTPLLAVDGVLEALFVGLSEEAVIDDCAVPASTVSRVGCPPDWHPANRHITAAAATATDRNRTDLPYSPDGWVITWGQSPARRGSQST